MEQLNSRSSEFLDCTLAVRSMGEIDEGETRWVRSDPNLIQLAERTEELFDFMFANADG